MHFLAVSFAFNIYQKLKSNDELENKLMHLFKSISNRLNKDSLQKLEILKDLEKCLNVDTNWVDKAIIMSCFLGDIPVSLIVCFVLQLFFFSLTLFVFLKAVLYPHDNSPWYLL